MQQAGRYRKHPWPGYVRAIYSILILILGTWPVGCALAPDELQPPAIFELRGELIQNEDDREEYGDRMLVALSWYIFKGDSLQPKYWALASQTMVSLNDTNGFTLALDSEPPSDAFVVTGENRFLDLPARGNLAIGFLTVLPISDDTAPFSWSGEDTWESTCPHETLLVVWWDGPELKSDQTGFRSGILRKGLNLVNLGDEEFRDDYVLYPAGRAIQIPVCAEGMRSPLRSCGLLGERSVETLFLDAETPQEDLFTPLEGEYHCGACGLSYRVPDFCTRRFNVLCRDCRSLVVETDPDRPVPEWPCSEVPSECDEEEDPLCIWGTLYRCQDNRWAQSAQCEDDCCEEGCQSVSQ